MLDDMEQILLTQRGIIEEVESNAQKDSTEND
jgi:hypothetical protein